MVSIEVRKQTRAFPRQAWTLKKVHVITTTFGLLLANLLQLDFSNIFRIVPKYFKP